MDCGVVGQVQQVRQFSRTVTQRVGALNDAFLARGRPLGQARLLWEIGPDGAFVRDLRSRLGLDSGYISRMLRSLEADGLIAAGAEFRRRARPRRLADRRRACGASHSRPALRRGGRGDTGAPQRHPGEPARGGHGPGGATAQRLHGAGRQGRSARARRPVLPERLLR